MTVKIVKLHPNAKIPTYGSTDAAGADLYACIDAPVAILPGQTVLIPTGLSMEIEQGFAGFIYARSGLATKRGLAPANKVGVIDCDYRGQVMVSLHNHTDQPQQVVRSRISGGILRGGRVGGDRARHGRLRLYRY